MGISYGAVFWILVVGWSFVSTCRRTLVEGYTFNGCYPFKLEAVDPIVNPGEPASPHLHTFFGSDRLDADIQETWFLLGGCSSCQNTLDKSAYWTPTLFRVFPNGTYQALAPLFRAYYDNIGNNAHPYPNNFKIVAGNSKSQNASDYLTNKAGVNWYCTAGPTVPKGEVRQNANFPTVPCPGLLAINIFFPNCYKVDNGNFVGMYSPCIEGWIEIPQLWFSMRYDTTGFEWGSDGTAPLWLSSGPSWTWHADFFSGWPQELAAEMITHKDPAGEFHIGGSINQPNCPDPYCKPKKPTYSIDYTKYIIGRHPWAAPTHVDTVCVGQYGRYR